MEKVLTYDKLVDGEVVEMPIRFRSTANLPLIYAEQFGGELFLDLSKIAGAWHPGDKEAGTKGYFEEFADMSGAYKVIWALAKCADKSIEPPTEWFDQFEDGIPVWVWFAELHELMTASFSGLRKNVPAAVSQQAQQES